MSEPIGGTPRVIVVRVLQRIAFLLGLSIGLGVVAGVVWWAVTPLPSYTVTDDGYASIGERGLAQVFAADAYFALLGVVVGLAIGAITAWRLGRYLGWMAVPTIVVDATVAALLCWGVGTLLGPGDFAPRLATAAAGELVPVALTVRSWVAVVVWPFLGLLPLLLWATLARDPQEPRPIRLPWRRAA